MQSIKSKRNDISNGWNEGSKHPKAAHLIMPALWVGNFYMLNVANKGDGMSITPRGHIYLRVANEGLLFALRTLLTSHLLGPSPWLGYKRWVNCCPTPGGLGKKSHHRTTDSAHTPTSRFHSRPKSISSWAAFEPDRFANSLL